MGVTLPEEGPARLCPAILGLCTHPHSPLPPPYLLELHPTKSSTFIYQMTGPCSLISVFQDHHSLCHWICWVKISGVQSTLLHKLTPRSRVLPEKLTNRSSSRQEISPYFMARSFITTFTTARRPSLSRARKIQFMPPIQLFEDQF
jgi:hypothetical protein